MAEQIAVTSHEIVAIFVGDAIFSISNGGGNNIRAVVVNGKWFSYWDKMQTMKCCDNKSFFFIFSGSSRCEWGNKCLKHSRVGCRWHVVYAQYASQRSSIWFVVIPILQARISAILCVRMYMKSERSMQISPLFKQRISFGRSLRMQIQNGRCCTLFSRLWWIHSKHSLADAHSLFWIFAWWCCFCSSFL